MPGRGSVPRPLLRTAVLVFSILVLVASDALQSFEIPLREIVLGDIGSPLLDRVGGFETSFLLVESRYYDLYRMSSPSIRHDYHMSDYRLVAMLRRGRLLYGVKAGKNSLTLEQDNVHTQSDRLRGGRSQAEGGVLVGFASRGGVGIPGADEIRLLGAIGWDRGSAASCEAQLSWMNLLELLVRAETFGREIEVSEEINGYRFPFPFPFRTNRILGRLCANDGPFRLCARLGYERSRGAGEKKLDFENMISVRRISAGGYLSRGAEAWGAEGTLLRKVSPGSILPGFVLTAEHNRLYSDLSMYRYDVRYLHLQGMNVCNSLVSLDVVPLAHVWISLGWERYGIRHDGESFFDVWPFALWDVFEAKRYRLAYADGRLDMWSTGIGACMIVGRYELAMRGRWEWWRDRGALRWLEREDILFPFFFTYVPHDEELRVANRYAVQLDPSVAYRLSEHAALLFSGRIFIPLGKREDKQQAVVPPTPAVGTAEKRIRGGLIGRIALVYSL